MGVDAYETKSFTNQININIAERPIIVEEQTEEEIKQDTIGH